MTKAEARILYKEKRLTVTVMQRDKMEDLMLIEFQKLNIAIPDLIMTYVSNDKLREYDPVLIERFCEFKNPQVHFAVPKIDRGDLHAIMVDESTTFIENKFGIGEPENGSRIKPGDIHMVFVPLLAFDKRGFRVGYGKGYYDKFFSQTNAETFKIGFSFFEAAETIDDINEFDIALDICITPLKTYHFN